MSHMYYRERIHSQLRGLKSKALERSDRPYAELGPQVNLDGRRYHNLSTNDYLNLGRDPRLVEAASRAICEAGVGASASRLVTGTHTLHRELEQSLCEFVGYSGCLVCGAGYLANLSALTGLAARQDTIIADKLVHASIIDAAKLSGANLVRFKHNSLNHLEQTLKRLAASRAKTEQLIVVTESVFSMDGDCAPLKDIVQLSGTHGAALMVDDAHAFGVFGERGQGLAAGLSLVDGIDVVSTTLSKAFGCYGGVVLADETMRKWLVNTARPFIYNTGLPPAMAAAGLEAVRVICRSPGKGRELLEQAERFRSLLSRSGLNTLHSSSQIVPVVVGDNETTLRFSRELFDCGIIGVPIRTPTVSEGTARVRFSLSSALSGEDVEQCAATIVDAAKRVFLK